MLLELKRQEEGEAHEDRTVDISYYARAHKATLGVDEGKLREYFPLEHTRRDFIDLRKTVKCDVRKANGRSSVARRSRVLRGLRERRYIKSGWILILTYFSKESIRTSALPASTVFPERRRGRSASRVRQYRQLVPLDGSFQTKFAEFARWKRFSTNLDTPCTAVDEI